MPYCIDWEPQGVYKKYTGQVTGQEFLKAVHTVNVSPNFHAYRYVINDFSDCTEFDLPGNYSDDALAAAIGAHASNTKFIAAFVARHPDIRNTLEALTEKASACLSTGGWASVFL